MRNARIRLYPNIPGTLAELANILRGPQHRVISMTYDGEDNMYADFVEATDGTQIVIFASSRMLEFMERVRIIFSDGTFSTPAVPHASQVSSSFFSGI